MLRQTWTVLDYTGVPNKVAGQRIYTEMIYIFSPPFHVSSSITTFAGSLSNQCVSSKWKYLICIRFSR